MKRETIYQLSYHTFYMIICATGIAALAIFVAHWWQVLVFGVMVGVASVLLRTLLEHLNVVKADHQVQKIPKWLKLIQLVVLLVIMVLTMVFTIRTWWLALLIGMCVGVNSLLIELLAHRLVPIN